MMKKWIFSLIALFATSLVFAATFNHSALKVGAIQESCYHEPCSVGKIVSSKIMESNNKSAMLELNVLGGSKTRSGKIAWNKKTHKVYVTCSKSNPTVTLGGQVTTLPINPEFFPGALYSDGEFYFFACHNYHGSVEDGARKFGYNVSDE